MIYETIENGRSFSGEVSYNEDAPSAVLRTWIGWY
jgi:hypothetical protein